ncbi:fungal-specific transcription factor domain-domain-containing protein [Aspergillus welwitschiae]|uniref:Fungal-specific transcription factor domain-domain-containing protein n=1 Tax=Aspergillus welwitschiae TaxID=1341132 RepID=A0A3F3PHU4_9EURO|nr:fungal-specific transcription factor domain-domain-containing protein [Aspergillus welwitschiae]RDH26525.1 fungal-specific transcription factor domain-domain-containing protein [Aspergillus welwitschiae]
MASNPESESASPCTSSASKVAIPRLSIREATARPRTRKACKGCRERKAKCDGHQPCNRCAALQFRATPEDGDLIARTLAHYSLSDMSDTITDHAHPPATGDDTIYAIECVQEDLHSSKALQPIGFIGGPSELSWIQDLNQEVERYTLCSEGETPNRLPSNDSEVLSRVSYFLDDQDLAMYGNIDFQIQPSQDVAERLLSLYFHTVHPSFPIISKLSFTQQVGSFYAKPDLRPPKKWLAILNLVFATAAKFAHLVPEHLVQSMDSPMVYFTRARRLSTTENQLTEHPNLQQVQIEGLTAFLCMASGHINRSWRACGIAIRSSIAMGINLRNQSKEISNISREIRYRVWWSLYTLENTLSVMTGRPTGTSDRFCTTPLPIPFQEEQFHVNPAARLLKDSEFRADYMRDFTSLKRTLANRPSNTDQISGQMPASKVQDIVPNTSQYFLYYVELTKIMRRAIDSLYSPGFARRPWLTIYAAMIDLVHETDEWLSCLAEEFSFKCHQGSGQFERLRWSLAVRFHSVRITICRPSLCRSGRHRQGTEPPKDLQQTAEICIDSACRILDLLPDKPDKPDRIWLAQVSPWWCVLHYLVQSATILLIELDYRVRTGADQAANINSRIGKALDWLSALAVDDLAAERAFRVCDNLRRRLFLHSIIEPDRIPKFTAELTTNLSPAAGVSSLVSQAEHSPTPVSSVPHRTGESAFTDSEMRNETTFHPAFQTAYDEFMPYNLYSARKS